MASDDKKTKADPVQKTKADPVAKSDAPKKDKSTADAKSTVDATSTRMQRAQPRPRVARKRPAHRPAIIAARARSR